MRWLCEVRGLARDPTTHCSCPCHDRPHVLFSNGPTCTVYSQGTVYSRGVTEAQRRWAPRTNLNSKATASLHKFEEVPAAASRRNNSRNAPKGTMRTAVEQGSPARGASNASCSASGRLRVASADSGGPSAGLPRKLFAWDRCVTMWCGDGCSTPQPACSGPVRRLYTSRRIDSRRSLSSTATLLAASRCTIERLCGLAAAPASRAQRRGHRSTTWAGQRLLRCGLLLAIMGHVGPLR